MHDNDAQSGGGDVRIPSFLKLRPAAADWVRRQRDLARLQETVVSSPLIRVVPIAERVVANGLAVECLALEMRELGATAWLRFGQSDPEDTSLRPGHPVVVVADSANTSYDVGAFVWARHRRSGESEIVFTPRPPDDVRELRLEVTQFVAPPPMPAPRGSPELSASINGPWTFTVATGGGLEPG